MNRLISLLLVIIIITILSSSPSSFISTAFADVTITSCPSGVQSLAQNTNHGKVVFDNIDHCDIDIRNSQVSSIEFSTACANNQINIENVQCVDSTVATCVHFSSDVQDSRDMTFKDITHTSVINFATPTEAKTQATIFFEKSLSMSRTSDFFQVEFSGISLRDSHCRNAICTSAAVHIKGEFTNVAYLIATNISIINTRGPSISTSVISALVFTTTQGISDDGLKKSELVIRGITVDDIKYDTPTAAGSLLITCFTTQGSVSQFTKVSFERMSIENSQLPVDNMLFVQIVVINLISTIAGAGDYIAAPSTSPSPSILSVDECHIRNVVIGPLNPYAHSFIARNAISGFTHIKLSNSGLHDIQTTGSPWQCQWFVHRFQNAVSFPVSTSFATSLVVENNTLENFAFTTRRYTISGILRADPAATISGVTHLKLSNAVVRNLSFTNNQLFDNYAFIFYGAITGTGTADSLLSATNMVKEDNQLTCLGGHNLNSVLSFNPTNGRVSNFTTVIFNNITSRREKFRAGTEVAASLVSMEQDLSGVPLLSSSSSTTNNFSTSLVFSNLVMEDNTVQQGGTGAAQARVVLLSKPLTNFDHILFSNISFNRNTGISSASTPGTTRSLFLGAVVIDGSVAARREQQQQQQSSSSSSSFIVENVAITYPKMVLRPREVSVQIYVYRQQNSNILNNFQTVVLNNNSIRHFHNSDDALPSSMESVAIHQFGSVSADTSGQSSSSNSSSFTMQFCNIENVSLLSNSLLAVSSLDVSSFISNFHAITLTNNEISDVTLVSQLAACQLAIYKLNSIIRITSSSSSSSNTLPSSLVVPNSSISSISLTATRDAKVRKFSVFNPASALQGYASVEFSDLLISKFCSETHNTPSLPPPLSNGAIIGIVLGVLCLVGVIGALLYTFLSNRSRIGKDDDDDDTKKSSMSTSSEEEEDPTKKDRRYDVHDGSYVETITESKIGVPMSVAAATSFTPRHDDDEVKEEEEMKEKDPKKELVAPAAVLHHHHPTPTPTPTPTPFDSSSPSSDLPPSATVLPTPLGASSIPPSQYVANNNEYNNGDGTGMGFRVVSDTQVFYIPASVPFGSTNSKVK